jgi:hypothetical protein
MYFTFQIHYFLREQKVTNLGMTLDLSTVHYVRPSQ